MRGALTPDAEDALARDPNWAAPLLWRSEFRNALLTHVRQRDLPIEEAIRVADDAENQMSGHEYTVITHRVLQLASRSGCSAYDCEFIALAHYLGIPLVTTDREILRAFPTVAVSLKAFARS